LAALPPQALILNHPDEKGGKIRSGNSDFNVVMQFAYFEINLGLMVEVRNPLVRFLQILLLE
jgi:hypothetical protein